MSRNPACRGEVLSLWSGRLTTQSIVEGSKDEDGPAAAKLNAKTGGTLNKEYDETLDPPTKTFEGGSFPERLTDSKKAIKALTQWAVGSSDL